MTMQRMTISPNTCAEGGGLMSVDEAITRAVSLVREVSDTELLGLEDAVGRVLAEDIRTPRSLPPFDNSAMDGFALRSADLSGDGPWDLTVTGRIAAGENAAACGAVGAGEAVRIFTGAGIPSGADAVIMQEHVSRAGDRIRIPAPVAAGSCIRRAGEDAAAGSLILSAGRLVGAREIAAIASVGLPRVRVRRKIRIALFCTGSELQQPGAALEPGQIYDVNRPMMLAALRRPWADVIDFGTVEDDPGRLRQVLRDSSRSSDLVISTGGVSVGEEDHMIAQLEAVGGQMEIMKVAMKPGKPLSVGQLGSAVYVGLPGNPVAAFTTWKIIGERIAAQLSGLEAASCGPDLAELSRQIRRRPGREEYRPVRVIGTSPTGHPIVEMLDGSFSAKISLICRSDGFAVIPAWKDRLEAGERLNFISL